MAVRTDIRAEINFSNLRKNIRNLKEHIHPSRIIGVVKANAYGHGVIEVSQVLREEGIDMFAVAFPAEAAELREAGIDARIIILDKLWDRELGQVFEYNLEPILASDDDFERLSHAAEERQQKLPVHLKIDTGMGRLGYLYNQYEEPLQQVLDHPWLELAGVMSHFSTADEPQREHTEIQADRYRKIHRKLQSLPGDNPPLFHLSNSGGALYLPETGYDMVRLGLSMYGVAPSREETQPFELHQVMQLKSKVAYIKNLPEGFPIGYGATYHTKKNSTILVCPGGYEDGIPRRYGGTGEVLIHRKRFPIVGNVSMDTFMVDVYDEPVNVGDEVVILGEQGGNTISVWEMAEKLGLIPYEVTCGISSRVGRVFVEEGEGESGIRV